MPGIYDRIKDTWTIASSTTLSVSSTFTVTGTAASGYQTFGTRYVTNEGNIPVAIVSQTQNQWMVCWCTYNPTGSTPNLLRIDTIIFSTSGDSSVTFSPATMDVFVTASSRAIPGLRENNTFTGTNSFSNISISGGVISGISDYDSTSAVTSASVNASINYIRTAGYYAAGDGGGALYKRVVSAPSHNGYITSNGSSVYWELSEILPNVKMFGAKNDVTFNSTTAIQNAIDYVEARNGGPLRLGSGIYRIESTLNMNATVAVDLYGDGADGIHDVAGTAAAATTLAWYGSAGGTVLAVQSPAATGHMQTGPSVDDVKIDCRGVAGIGLLVKSVRGGTFRRIYVLDSTISAFKLTNYDKNVSGEATDTNSCVFDRLSWRCIDSAAVRPSHGLWLTADSFVGNANVSLNTFEQCSGQNWGGSANAAVNITGITQASPGVVTANSHGLVNGDIVYVTSVVGMTQVNDRRFTVAGATANTFQLSGVNTTSYTAYTSGGTVSKITQASGHGLFLECGDNNNFYRCAFYRANSGTGGTFYEGVRIEGNQGTDSNNFWNLSIGGANSIQIRGIASGYNNDNTRNSFWCVDNSNGTQYPIVDSGCIFTWHSDLNAFEKLLASNVVIADNAAVARSEAASIGGGSLRIRNGSQNHVQLTDGTNVWGIALVPDFRITRLSGSSSLNLGNGASTYATGDIGLGTSSLLANTKVTISANNNGDAVNITQSGAGNGLTVNTRVGVGTSGILTDLFKVQGGSTVRAFSVLTSGKVEARYNDNAMHGDVLTIANNGINASTNGAGLRFNLDAANGAGIESAYIRAVASDTYAAAGNRSAGLAFGTINAGTLAERLRIDNSGNIGIGITTPSAVTGTTGANIVMFNSVSTTPLVVCRNQTNDGNSSRWFWDKERAGSIIQNGDTLGQFFFRGYDGAAFTPAASITAQVDAAPGAGDMPGRLIFSTTADGASSTTERMRITNAGYVGVNVTPTARFHVQAGSVGNGVPCVYFQKPRDATNAQRYTWEDCGGLTGDANGGAFWRGFHIGCPTGGITDPSGGATRFPLTSFYFEYNTIAAPTTRRFVTEIGNDTTTSSHDFVIRSGSVDRLTVTGTGDAAIGTAPNANTRLSVTTPNLTTALNDVQKIFRLTSPVVNGVSVITNSSNVDLTTRRHTAGTDWVGTNVRFQRVVDVTGAGFIDFGVDGVSASTGIGFGTGTTTYMRMNGTGDWAINSSNHYAKLHINTTDNALGLLVSGTARGVRIVNSATSGLIEGVDQTGTGSYQPLGFGGSEFKFAVSATNYLQIDTRGVATIVNDQGPASTDVNAVGFRGIPSNEQSGSTYTIALTDSGKAVVKMVTTALTVTIPANTTTAFPIGTTIMIDNSHPAAYTATAGILTITPAADVGIIGAGATADNATPNRFKNKLMSWPRQASLRKIRNKGSTVTLSSLTASTQTATATFSAAHGYNINDFVIIAGGTNTAFNGTFRVLTTASTTQLTYQTVSATPGTPSGTHTATPADLWVITGDYTNSPTA